MEKFIKSEAGRRWLYRVALAVIALCVVLGFITDEVAASVGALVAALVALPVASANTTNAGAHDDSSDLH